MVRPVSRPDLTERYPLILTCAKNTLVCETQHRALPSLRRQAIDPEVELHPASAAGWRIHPGDWARAEPLDGSVRARACFNDGLQPNVACGQHGWRQATPEIDAPGCHAFSPHGATLCDLHEIHTQLWKPSYEAAWISKSIRQPISVRI